MASAETLVALFDAMARNLQQDRPQLNQLDFGDNDAGDNMAANFDLITRTLAQRLQGQGESADIGAALQEANEVLRREGRGATAPIYAQGLAEAGQRLQGKHSFSMDDLLPLLEGLASGSQQASGTGEGQGSLLDVLLPSVRAYREARNGGQSELVALLNGLLTARRAANGTAASSQGYGRSSGVDTTGRIDPGAAGAASLLEGLFGSLLGGALGGASPAPATPPPAGSGAGLGDLLGVLMGMVQGGQAQPSQPSAPRRRSSRRSHRK